MTAPSFPQVADRQDKTLYQIAHEILAECSTDELGYLAQAYLDHDGDDDGQFADALDDRGDDGPYEDLFPRYVEYSSFGMHHPDSPHWGSRW